MKISDQISNNDPNLIRSIIRRRQKLLPKLIYITINNLQTEPYLIYNKNYNHIIFSLKKALNLERKRGKHNNWAYDYNRHKAILRALNDEENLYKVINSQNLLHKKPR